ncbi:hypothetical protein ACFXTH_023046 [Malus domestica]
MEHGAMTVSFTPVAAKKGIVPDKGASTCARPTKGLRENPKTEKMAETKASITHQLQAAKHKSGKSCSHMFFNQDHRCFSVTIDSGFHLHALPWRAGSNLHSELELELGLLSQEKERRKKRSFSSATKPKPTTTTPHQSSSSAHPQNLRDYQNNIVNTTSSLLIGSMTTDGLLYDSTSITDADGDLAGSGLTRQKNGPTRNFSFLDHLKNDASGFSGGSLAHHALGDVAASMETSPCIQQKQSSTSSGTGTTNGSSTNSNHALTHAVNM